MGNDRLKMAFWFDMLFDNDLHNDTIHELPPDGLRVDIAFEEVRNWLKRNSLKSPFAQSILDAHTENVALGNTAGSLPPDLWQDFVDHGMIEKLKAEVDAAYAPSKDPSIDEVSEPHSYLEERPSKYEQDRLYGRVSHEIDVWWKRVRDANYDEWVVPMETVEKAKERAEAAKDSAMTRYIPRVEQDADLEFDHREQYEEDPEGDVQDEHESGDQRSVVAEDGEDEVEEDEEEEEEEDDDSYVEGPLRGLLTEIPNILDTKQIEALHMTVKACIVDAMGSGLTPSGENLQKTRCKMFLALDCGKNLLREMLVFIAVWEQAETQFIFQITAQIIESFHHNALLPYAWNSLRILKDIVSPAQTVLLRLINYMFTARKGTTIYNDAKDLQRDSKLIHFLYNYFRCRVVPDCIALMYAQSQIRLNHAHPQDFPVDLWDMERAKDGLSQYLEFISVIAEIPEMRHWFIDWDTTYELIALLEALDKAVARKPLVDPIRRNPPPAAARPPPSDATISDEDLESPELRDVNPAATERPYDPSPPPALTHPNSTQESVPGPAPGLPPLHDTPHKFAWQNIKVQILMIFASLVAPSNGRTGPGNPIVQKQILEHQGLMPLLNCCVYDGNNEYLKERATLALKWVMDGCEEAQNFVRELSPLRNQQPSQANGPGLGNMKVAGNGGKTGASGMGGEGSVADVGSAMRSLSLPQAP
jgi:palmitoyltransferase